MNKIALSLVLLSIATIADAFDFKGVEIGKPATPEFIQEKLGVKCGI